MTATATPTIYDPKVTLVSSLSTSANTTIYTAPNEAGANVNVWVTNKTTSPVQFNMQHQLAGAGTFYNLAYQMNIVPDGSPVIFEGIYLAATDVLAGSAGTATALDVAVYRVELKD